MKYNWRNKALGYLQISSSEYKDASKVTKRTTPKGNYRLYYDGRDTGMTIGRMYI